MWIGCADSRVPSSQITGLMPGEIFVHRNVASIVSASDVSALSVIQFAVDNLKVSHIILCGHKCCGGVRAAMGKEPIAEPLGSWLKPLRDYCEEHAAEIESIPDVDDRWQYVVEENVKLGVRTICSLPTVQAAWARGQKLAVHGWSYQVDTGLIKDLDMTAEVGFEDEEGGGA